MNTLPLISATLADFRALTSPSSKFSYLTPDGGVWDYVSAMSAIDNGGTVVKGFVRRLEGKTVTPAMFGAKADGITDDFDALQAALNAIGSKGTLQLAEATYFLDKSLAKGLDISENGIDIRIIGKGPGSIIKLGRNVTRLINNSSNTDPALTKTYSNIMLRNFNVDANNVDGSVIAPQVTVAADVVGNNTYIDVNVGSNTGFLNGGSCFFPLTNAGTSKGKQKAVRLKTGSSTTIQILLATGETLLTGDKVKGAVYGGVIMGSFFSAGDGTGHNLNWENITIQDIDVINLPPQEAVAYNSGLTNLASTKRGAVLIETFTAASRGISGGYSGLLYAKNITIERVRCFGGFAGFGIIGSSSLTDYSDLSYGENITLKDLYHNSGVVPANQSNGFNFLIGFRMYGNNVNVMRCVGEGSSDVGVETGAFMRTTVTDCLIKNCAGADYYSTNYLAPAFTSAGAVKTTVTAAIGTGDTTIPVTTFAAGLSTKGWLTVDNELMYYTYSGTTTIGVVRGLNGGSGVSHLSGATVRFVEIDKQSVIYDRCFSENTLLTTINAKFGWLQTRNAIYPNPPVIINNCNYLRKGLYLSPTGGEIASFNGNQNVTIKGFVATIGGIVKTGGAFNGVGIYFNNFDYDLANGINSKLPPTTISINGLTINTSGALDGATGSRYYGIRITQGNYLLNIKNLAIRNNFTNVSSLQSFGIVSNNSGIYLTGVVEGYKFSATGDISPVGIFLQNSTVNRLAFNDLDFTELEFGTPATNANYKPWLIDTIATNSSYRNIYFGGNIKHSLLCTLPAAKDSLHGVPVTANYTTNHTEGYIGVTTVPVTITLASVEANGGATSKTNYRVLLIIQDETFTAATNNITITPAAGEKINNSTASIVINTNTNGFKRLLSIPGGWVTI